MTTRRRKAGEPTAQKREAHVQEEEGDRPYTRVLLQGALVICSLLVIRTFVDFEEKEYGQLATINEDIPHRFIEVGCSSDYDKEKVMFKGCIPSICGRVIMDHIVTREEAAKLLDVAKKGLSLGGSNGGASILDLHSGALSKGDKFVDIFSLQKTKSINIFTEDDFKLYTRVKDRIQHTITAEFGIPREKLFLTNPTFFSQMTTKPAQTVHDEYWHPHVDKETYGSFHYTSLLYLSEYGTDFKGGRFVFVDKDINKTVDPKRGRLSFFTSGSENLHYVEKLTSGTRYAITVSFTCNPQRAIDDPTLR
ncbi:2-oxoglutarate and iron-dependent oxygenase domain-containing protein 3-like [Lingula anatina]|uniref:2-oxoglutarate and iron-dependent oxygenase domain-containing protein 3-like n=1 Tax=Lingula anatina TaxID=7574 RepID=A0A1S3J2I1_LINAN|nr:2-oxoglutarate and iron-dependent oxygenase domain-containing protein 3-like [Lingula anatina]|eukprot:XP_013404610.1 2-oxoglutarate and iron-dependent oxygenase domain-containing protein 3-like [Lingula anatina]